MQTMNNHNGKISEALALLNEAAKDKKEEVQKLLSSKYKDIREVLEERLEESREKFGQFRETTQEAIHEGQVRVKKAAREADKEVHSNPWKYIGIAAGCALVAGFFMGRSSKE